mmetsp:Transcript_17620/g.67028  ORF Transcript_17620/g.67028 Transcript_17620/m.67028 type:complete len:256 (+) Transcript_17620:1692-2459(+)
MLQHGGQERLVRRRANTLAEPSHCRRVKVQVVGNAHSAVSPESSLHAILRERLEREHVVEQRARHVVLDGGRHFVPDLGEVAPCVHAHQRVADAPYDAREAAQGLRVLVIAEEAVALQQGHLDVQPRQEIADARGLVEPVPARLLCFHADICADEVHRQLAAGSGRRLRLGLDPLKDKTAEPIEHLGHLHEQRGIERRHGHVSKHAGHLYRQLESEHSFFIVPRRLQRGVQTLQLRGQLLLADLPYVFSPRLQLL